MLESAIDIPFWLEMIATVFCAISGAMAAVRARYDILGVTCLAVMTGLAGGMIRDLFLQDYGIYAFQQPSLIVASLVMGIVVFYLGRLVTYFDPITDLVECMATALFVILGTGKALSADQTLVPAVILGLMTAVGGGIMRDICMARPPRTFLAGPLYTTAALIGGVVFALMKQTDIPGHYAALTGIVLVIVIRYAALYFNWQTHAAQDQSGKVARVITKPVVMVAQAARPPKGKIAREKSLSTYGKIAARLQTWVAKMETDSPTDKEDQTAPNQTLETKTAPEHTTDCDCLLKQHATPQEGDHIKVNRKEFLTHLNCVRSKHGHHRSI